MVVKDRSVTLDKTIVTLKPAAVEGAARVNEKTRDYIRENLFAANTSRGYAQDMRTFSRWIEESGRGVLELQDIIDFFNVYKEGHKLSSLQRMKVTLNKSYSALMHSEAFILYFRALTREKSVGACHSKPLLDSAFLEKWAGIKPLKYRLLFALQFKGAFRVSELLNLRKEDVIVKEEGLEITLQRSKTSLDPVTIGIKNNGINVSALWEEYKNSVEEGGRVFPMAYPTVHDYVKRHFGTGFSTHSLRSGHITSALLKGKSIERVMKTSRHKSYSTVINNYFNPISTFENTSDLV